MSLFFINLESTAPERFDLSRFFDPQNTGYDPLTSAFASDLLGLPVAGSYEVRGEDGRPDLLSYRIYNHTQYWWVLMLYNRKTEFSGFVTGDLISFPSLDDLESLYFGLKQRQTQAGL